MSEKDRKDEEEQWETEEFIFGVSNIDNGESDWEEPLQQNIIPQEEWEAEEHIVGVSNVEDDGGIDWEQISGQDYVPEREEEWETEDYIAGVPNIEFHERPIYILRIERNNIPEEQEEIKEEQEEIKIEFETEEHVVGVSNLTEDDIIPERVIEYDTIEEEEFSEELINTDDDIIPKERETLVNNKMEKPNINVPNFRERIMEQIKMITTSIDCADKQKKIILSKSEEILDKHISRAENGEIIIKRDTNIKSHAGAIIYAVILSNEDLPRITGKKLSILVDTYYTSIPKIYKRWYKDLAPRLDYSFKDAQLGRSRKIFSLYFFELLNNAEIDLQSLISHLENFDVSKIVLRLREIFIGAEKQLTQKENIFLEHLTEREIKKYKDMGANYSDTFDKYFSDLIEIVKMLILSNKSHITIKAEFIISDFAKYLMSKNINMFLKESSLAKEIGRIVDFLKNSKYSNFFPIPTRTGQTLYSEDETNNLKKRIIGNRIKLYVMKYIYNGKYFDIISKIPYCEDCLYEKLEINSSFPRIISKEFHHKGDKYETYTVEDLYGLFLSNRGNPFFLRDLIRKMEREFVVVKCGVHHILLHSTHFNNFKKLINWENLPSYFFYKDIFELPAEIIHALIMICVDNIPLDKIVSESFRKDKSEIRERKDKVKVYILEFLKKRFFIDFLYGGICPICGEFNSKDHLPGFEYSHLYKLKELSMEDRIRRENNSISKLFESKSCIEILRELKKRHHIGCFMCHNCHFVIHEDLSNIEEIYDDKDILKKVLEDNKSTFIQYKLNLIYNKELTRDPLDIDIRITRTFIKYFFTIFKISEEKGLVTSSELANKMGVKSGAVNLFFNTRKEILEKYGKINYGKGKTQTVYYMNSKGKEIVKLMFYFKNYYQNF